MIGKKFVVALAAMSIFNLSNVNYIAGGVQRTDHVLYVNLDPDSMRKMLASLERELEKLADMGYGAVVLTSPAVRLYFKKLVSRSVQGLTIVSRAEITPNIEIQILGVVRI